MRQENKQCTTFVVLCCQKNILKILEAVVNPGAGVSI